MSAIFRRLQPAEFAAALEIRIKVFVEEQHVPLNEEQDELDAVAQHFGIFLEENLIGTGRLVQAGRIGKIGRVALLKNYRNRGFGKKLLETIIASGRDQGLSEFVLGAQLQAVDFYSQLGFVPEGEEFMDGGIPHVQMRLVL